MEFIIGYDFETQDGGEHIRSREERYGPQYREITQTAGVAFFPDEVKVVEKNMEFWAWTKHAQNEQSIQVIPGAFVATEPIILELFLNWIIDNAKIAQTHNKLLYMVAHNGLGFDLPFMEERIIRIMENQPERTQIFLNIITNPIWNNIIWVDSLAMSFEYYPDHKPNYKLPSIYQTISGQELQNAHQALPDSKAVLEIVKSFPKTSYNGRKANWVLNFQDNWNSSSFTGDKDDIVNWNDSELKTSSSKIRNWRFSAFKESVVITIYREKRIRHLIDLNKEEPFLPRLKRQRLD